MTFNRLLPLCIILPIAACSGGASDNPVGSGFLPVNGANQVDVYLEDVSHDSVSNAQVGTVAYVAGVVPDVGQIAAYSGIAPNPNVGSAQTSGSATYLADYEYYLVDRISRSPTLVTGTLYQEAGTIALNANFNTGQLTGNAATLDVNGTISGSNIGGTVTADYGFLPSESLTGSLTGNIGTNGVIGAFTGQDSNTALAGGFVGTRN